MPYKEYIIRKSVKDRLPAVMQEYLYYNFGSDYCTIPPKEWTGLFGALQARYYRRCVHRESQKLATKKNRADQPDEADTNSQLIPSVTCNKLKPKSGKVK